MDVCCLSIDRQNYISTNKAVSCLSLGLIPDCAGLRQFLQLDDNSFFSQMTNKVGQRPAETKDRTDQTC